VQLPSTALAAPDMGLAHHYYQNIKNR